MFTYFQAFPPMSHKYNRMGLITLFYTFVDVRAYKDKADPLLKEQWDKLKSDWVTLYSIPRVNQMVFASTSFPIRYISLSRVMLCHIFRIISVYNLRWKL